MIKKTGTSLGVGKFPDNFREVSVCNDKIQVKR